MIPWKFNLPCKLNHKRRELASYQFNHNHIYIYIYIYTGVLYNCLFIMENLTHALNVKYTDVHDLEFGGKF